MPSLDLPLEKLETYLGSSPCPSDIDQYWEEALKELDGLDPQVELIPNPEFKVPFAECFDLSFTGLDGCRIYAKYLRPKNAKEPHPAVLQFHGYTMNSGDWQDKLNYVAAGYSFAAMDCRGQGGKSQDRSIVSGNTFRGHIVRGLEDGPQNLLYRRIFCDTVQLARIIMELDEVDTSRVGTIGGSQGGALSLVCAALEPRIARSVAVHPFLCDYRRVWQMDLAKGAYEEIRTHFRQFDPLHEQEDQVFETLGYIDIQNLVHRIQGKVLMGLSLMDMTCPPSTQFAAYNKITSEKQRLIYPDYGHEVLPKFNDRAYEFMMGL